MRSLISRIVSSRASQSVGRGAGAGLISISDNIKEFQKKLTDFEKKQLPFAIMIGTNKTAFGLRKEMGKQTVKKLDRPTPATQKGFIVKKANKKTLTAEVAIKDFVADYLKFQIDGGTRFTGKKIPVPYTPNARLNKFGNIPNKRKGLIKRPTKQFIANIGGVSGVYEKSGRGGKQLKLIIAFEDSVTYDKKPFPFYKIGEGYISGTYNRNLSEGFKRAIKTARK
tara:strand:+ start:45 stop:719 length:675 start_codon:yes stop_codon:yes gene_type:complete